MRFFFFILSITTLMSATQPIWDVACKSLTSGCGVTQCDSPADAPLEEDAASENPNRQCCPSFQCCFLALGAFSTPYWLVFQDPESERSRPFENTKYLQSSFIQEYFDPPDFAFFS